MIPTQMVDDATQAKAVARVQQQKQQIRGTTTPPTQTGFFDFRPGGVVADSTGKIIYQPETAREKNAT